MACAPHVSMQVMWVLYIHTLCNGRSMNNIAAHYTLHLELKGIIYTLVHAGNRPHVSCNQVSHTLAYKLFTFSSFEAHTLSRLVAMLISHFCRLTYFSIYSHFFMRILGFVFPQVFIFCNIIGTSVT